MKIYFAGSIRGGRRGRKTYAKIIEHLKKFGVVLTEHICNRLSCKGEKLESKRIYERDIKWLREADIVVAEVTFPSLGVGYEIAKAEEMEKKIICLFNTRKRKKLSAMIEGNKNIILITYKNLEEAFKKLDEYLIQ
ncbi:MAG: nucleoside 2-deoxyribosyltransferase [Candidatus Parvarchaeota archaeon]|nr:nucleoside 2-deoxyribosyltransferase [Candidatus Jingweiarchaeum tengchongense]MCW1298185.1 nucleoside 2-deoxyribosyltransferase [Candidatus Jingweiarchaeum tengchongense]MCW1299983.1 nucleoside 2-deoxyribosyltransferase [Candidatus Jingweiarchaeum tengchongense]MCW1305027.1 nucleoside 2-deoxyribosyltransferase [Candidatus Jingweiarchaeum tengchongense]MCW1305468.1 nucleoside 2-deoxyribosyltransferase [Candidatus Jingweiarchaeum tengchongense]